MTHLQKVQRQQPANLKLGNEAALLVSQANPVGIAVIGNADVSSDVDHCPEQCISVGGDWLRLAHPRKEWIPIPADGVKLHGATVEETIEPTSAHTPHGVVDYSEAGPPDRLQIQMFADVFHVCRCGIEGFDQPLGRGHFQGHALHVLQ